MNSLEHTIILFLYTEEHHVVPAGSAEKEALEEYEDNLSFRRKVDKHISEVNDLVAKCSSKE